MDDEPNPFDEQYKEYDEMQGEAMHDMGLDEDMIETINEGKRNGMFVSAWQDDEQGILEKDPMCAIEAFLTAAEENAMDKVKRMLEENPDAVNYRDVDNYTALHRACYEGHVEMAKLLLDNGSSIEAKTSEGWTPLHSACNWAKVGAVGFLISHGADVNAVSKGGNLPIHVALNSKEEPEDVFHTVRYLVEAAGIDLSAQNGSGDSPLVMARRCNQACYELIKDRLERL